MFVHSNYEDILHILHRPPPFIEYFLLDLKKKKKETQADLGDITGSVPDHGDRGSHDLFAGGGSCVQFVKTKKNQHL